jgi:hypothetical protein
MSIKLNGIMVWTGGKLPLEDPAGNFAGLALSII